MIENVIDTTENCRFCLMCRHVAPVGLITYQETLTPHGIALTVAAQRRGQISWNPESVGVIYSEPDGGNCRAHCVTSQPLPAAIAAVRAEIVSQELAPAAVTATHDPLSRWSNPYAQEEPQTPSGSGPVALFVGDETAYLEPDTLPAVRKLLAAASVDPVLVGIGRNNGLLASSLGYPATAQNLIQATLTEIEECGAEKLLVLSPGDRFALGQMAEERLGINWPAGVEMVEVMDVLHAQYDAGQLRFQPMALDEPYAYVDPTHAVRVPGRFEPVRRLVNAVMPGPGLELFWRRERALPVGSTHLQFSRPELADQLTRARLADARDRGAKRLLCEDSGTLHQLRRFAGEYAMHVQNLYVLLANQLV